MGKKTKVTDTDFFYLVNECGVDEEENGVCHCSAVWDGVNSPVIKVCSHWVVRDPKINGIESLEWIENEGGKSLGETNSHSPKLLLLSYFFK